MPAPTQTQEIRGFLGVNLRKDRLAIDDAELGVATNVDTHTEVGAVRRRAGASTLFDTPLGETTVRRLFKPSGGTRYQVAGETLYRAQTAIATDLSATHVTTFVAARPLNDSTTWTFIADDAVMRKDNGTTLRTWGIAAPVTPSMEPGLGGTLTGAYTAVVTYLRFDGTSVAHESNPCDAPASVSPSAQAIGIGDIAHPTDAQVNGIGIYRTAAGGSVHLLDSREAIPSAPEWGVTFDWEATATGSGGLDLHWSIPDTVHTARVSQDWEATADFTGGGEDAAGVHTTNRFAITDEHVTTQTLRWAYATTVADSALASTAVETDNDGPPLASWATAFQEHVFLCRDADNPNYLWYSKRLRPEAFPADHFLEIGTAGDPLQCAVPVAGLLGVFSRQTKYRVTGNAVAGFTAQEAISRRGTPAPNAVCVTEHGIAFLARDGIFVTNLLAPDQDLAPTLHPLFVGEAVNGYDPIHWAAIETAAMATYKGRLYVALPHGSATVPNLLWVYSTATQHWVAYDLDLASLVVEEDTDQLTAGGTDGLVRVLEDPDASESVTMTIDLPDRTGASASVRKLFLYLRPDVDCDGDTVTVKVYADGTLRRTTTLTGTRTKPLLPFAEGSMGYAWRLRVEYTGTARPAVYGCAALWQPLGGLG